MLLWRRLVLLRGLLVLLRLGLALLLLRRRLTLLRDLLTLHRRSLMLLRRRLTLLRDLLTLLRRCLVLLLRRLLMLLRRGYWTLLELRLLLALDRGGDPNVSISCERLADNRAGRTAMIDVGKLRPVCAGSLLMLDLRSHGRRVLFAARRHFRRPGPHLDTALAAIEANATAAAMVVADRMVIDVAVDGDVNVVNRAVVVKVAAVPVAALVADADIAEAIIDAAVVADVRAPVATVEAVAMVMEAPVAGRPESAGVGSLNPCAGHPIVAAPAPGPIAGSPQVVVAGSLRLIVVGQRRRRLGGIIDRLLSIPWIVGALIIRLVGSLVAAAIIGGRSALFGVRSRLLLGAGIG